MNTTADHSEIPYVILGIVIGGVSVWGYNEYMKRQAVKSAVDTYIKLITNDKVPADADAKVAILNLDGKSKVIDYMPLTKAGGGAFKGSLPLNNIPTGAYLLTVAFYKDNAYLGDIETEVTIPNDIGMTVPDHEIRQANTLGVNLRG